MNIKKTEEKTIKTGRLYRSLSFDRKAVNAEARTAELTFSSETPYDRWFGTEILDHATASVRLDRLNDGGALLRNHSTSQHIGVVERAAIGDDRVGRAVVRFGKGAEAEAAFRDVQDGILRHVSVGYLVHRMVMEEEKDGHETYRVMDWEPIEVSLVPIPADPTVGVGRADEPRDVLTTVVRAVPEPQPTQPLPQPLPQQERVHIMTDPVKKPEDLERERTSALMTLGEQYAKYVTSADVANAIRNGHSVEMFKDVIMNKMTSKHSDTREALIGMDAKEISSYSLCRAIVAAGTGDWSKAGLERAASQAMASRMGMSPTGFYVPFDVFRRDFNVGTGSEAGNLVATDLRTDLFVDVLRNRLVFGKLGVRLLVGLSSNIDIPKKTVASAISRVTEIQALTETNPNTGKVSLTPKRFGGFVEYSKQALIQAAMSIEGMVREDLLMSAAVDIQDQWMNGSGSAPNMRGIRNTSGIGSVAAGTNGLAPAWSHFVDLESACANANAEPDQFSGYVINTKTRGALKKTQKATNLPFIWDNGEQPLNGYRAAVTNSMPSNLTKGTSTTIASSAVFGSDFSMSVLGFFGAPDVTVDPFSLATTGQVRVTLNQYADHGVRIAACFASCDDLLA